MSLPFWCFIIGTVYAFAGLPILWHLIDKKNCSDAAAVLGYICWPFVVVILCLRGEGPVGAWKELMEKLR